MQLAPFALTGLEQTPLLQAPTSWHESVAGHCFVLPLLQTPAWHVSETVQALPSSQAVLSGLGALVHVPVCGLHAPGSWH